MIGEKIPARTTIFIIYTVDTLISRKSTGGQQGIPYAGDGDGCAPKANSVFTFSEIEEALERHRRGQSQSGSQGQEAHGDDQEDARHRAEEEQRRREQQEAEAQRVWNQIESEANRRKALVEDRAEELSVDLDDDQIERIANRPDWDDNRIDEFIGEEDSEEFDPLAQANAGARL